MLLKSLRIFWKRKLHVQCGDSSSSFREDGNLYVSVWVSCGCFSARSVQQFELMSFASVRIAHDHYASEQHSMSFGTWHYDSWSGAPWMQAYKFIPGWLCVDALRESRTGPLQHAHCSGFSWKFERTITRYWDKLHESYFPIDCTMNGDGFIMRVCLRDRTISWAMMWQWDLTGDGCIMGVSVTGGYPAPSDVILVISFSCCFWNFTSIQE